MDLLDSIDTKIALYNDDCLNIFKTIEDESIKLLITDPPILQLSTGILARAAECF